MSRRRFTTDTRKIATGRDSKDSSRRHNRSYGPERGQPSPNRTRAKDLGPYNRRRNSPDRRRFNADIRDVRSQNRSGRSNPNRNNRRIDGKRANGTANRGRGKTRATRSGPGGGGRRRMTRPSQGRGKTGQGRGGNGGKRAQTQSRALANGKGRGRGRTRSRGRGRGRGPRSGTAKKPRKPETEETLEASLRAYFKKGDPDTYKEKEAEQLEAELETYFASEDTNEKMNGTGATNGHGSGSGGEGDDDEDDDDRGGTTTAMSGSENADESNQDTHGGPVAVPDFDVE